MLRQHLDEAGRNMGRLKNMVEEERKKVRFDALWLCADLRGVFSC